MRVLMAISADGYTARGPCDDMKWTGPDDKRLFRSLTCVGGSMLAGARTYASMCALSLPGRRLFQVDPTSKFTLKYYAKQEQEQGFQFWLIGGQTTAMAALRGGYVSEAHFVLSPKKCGGNDPRYVDTIRQWLVESTAYLDAINTMGDQGVHEVWRL